jgi:SAM-dependent methyltransferase
MSILPLCNVCESPLGQPCYESTHSLTSLCDVFPQPTRVRMCPQCGHLQTDALEDAAAFYDEDYTILVSSEEEDQIYTVRDGEPLYRTAHQVETLLGKFPLAHGATVLDFGCAKSATWRAISDARPDIQLHLFDISDRYIPFWSKFLTSDNWATYEVPVQWTCAFDLVTSFFSMEHMVAPRQSIADMAALLKPGGTLYAIVPNVLTNIADALVIDHVNHFTRRSLEHLLGNAGLTVENIDASAHRGAFVVQASRPCSPERFTSPARPEPGELAELAQTTLFWQDAADRVRAFEAELDGDSSNVAVYGAGFYGAFLRSSLAKPGRVACILDQNPYLQGTHSAGVPVLAPSDLPTHIKTLLVGLNPAHARSIVADVKALATRQLHYFYL